MQESFGYNLHENAEGEDTNYIDIVYAVLIEERALLRLRHDEGLYEKESYDQEERVAARGEEEALPRDDVRLFKILLPERARKERVRSNGKSDRHGDHKVLHGERDRKRARACIRVILRYVN